MLVRRSLLLASITAVGISVAGAQSVGVGGHPRSVAEAPFADPFEDAPPVIAAAMQPGQAVDLGSPPGADPFAAASVSADPLGPASAQGAVSTAGAPLWPAPATGATVAAVPSAPSANPFAAKPAAPAAPASVPGTPLPAAPAFSLEPVASEAAAGGPAAAAEAKPPADDAALRYYASQRDLARVGAEIRRLKTLYPGWQVPSDLFAPQGGAEEQPLWTLFGEGRLAEVRAAIERIKTEKVGWTPSVDLAQKLGDGEARAAIAAAAASGDWRGAIAAAQARPGLLACGNIDMLWTIGEAFARTADPARAYDVYAYVLKTCDDPEQRLATYQKAGELLPQEGLASLASFGRVLPGGRGEFDALRFGPLRKAMADVASGASTQLPPADQLKAYADFVRASRSPDDLGLVGWYFFGQKNFARAAEWFHAGMDAGGDAKVTEGYVLSLRNDDRFTEAEEIAHRAYRLSPELTKIYLEMVADQLGADAPAAPVDAAVVDRFEAAVTTLESAFGAQSIGWYLVKTEKVEDAQGWFERSVDWKPTEEGVVGLAVAATRLKDAAALKRIRASYLADFPALADFQSVAPAGRQTAAAASTGQRPARTGKPRDTRKGGGGGGDALMAEANRRYEKGDFTGALEVLDKREARRGKEYGAEILRGWANHRLKRWSVARDVFEAEDKRHSTRDTRFGIGATSNSQYRMWSESDNKCRTWGKC